MTYCYAVRPPVLEVVETPSFDEIRDGNGILQLEVIGPVISPLVYGTFQVVCRVRDAFSGTTYLPRYADRLRATAYFSRNPLVPDTGTRDYNYLEPLSEEQKAAATRVNCGIAIKPMFSETLDPGIFAGLNITFPWHHTMFMYIEFSWVGGAWTIQPEARAQIAIGPITPADVRPLKADRGKHSKALRLDLTFSTLL
ncbi:hypothetical protein F4802DRAFT_592873 [Xylaria palmicola]|nr:hypothetical protein F4802DRAFT_592873 [Xylaria palmicola]